MSRISQSGARLVLLSRGGLGNGDDAAASRMPDSGCQVKASRRRCTRSTRHSVRLWAPKAGKPRRSTKAAIDYRPSGKYLDRMCNFWLFGEAIDETVGASRTGSRFCAAVTVEQQHMQGKSGASPRASAARPRAPSVRTEQIVCAPGFVGSICLPGTGKQTLSLSLEHYESVTRRPLKVSRCERPLVLWGWQVGRVRMRQVGGDLSDSGEM